MAELTDLGLVWTKINGEYVAKVESGGKTVVLKISNGVLTANGKTVPGVHPVVQDIPQNDGGERKEPSLRVAAMTPKQIQHRLVEVGKKRRRRCVILGLWSQPHLSRLWMSGTRRRHCGVWSVKRKNFATNHTAVNPRMRRRSVNARTRRLGTSRGGLWRIRLAWRSARAGMRVRTTSGPTMSGGLGKNHAGIGAMTSTVITGVPARATHMRLRFVAIHASVTLSSPSVKRLAERIKAEDNRRELVH